MNRDEVIAKWNSMQPRERDAWVAESIMGQKWQGSELGMIPHSIPYYTQYADDSWEVLKRMNENDFYLNDLNVNEFNSVSESICLGSLVTVLTQGEGIEE